MGGSQSKNVAKITLKAISKVATNIIQNQKISVDTGQMISVSGGKGDVVISGNHMNQQVQVDMDQLLKAMVTQEAQQNLASEVAQQAKSLMSGINLFQFTDATNILDSYMEASIDINTTVSQTCLAEIGQKQVINVDNRDGNITITDNTFEQVTNIFSKCVEDIISNNKTIQDIQQKIDQTAVAESKGFSIWALVAMALIALLFLLAPLIFGTGSMIYILTKFLFPLLMFAGITLIALYFTMFKDDMKGYGFSKLLATEKQCGAVKSVIQPENIYENGGEASQGCLKNKDCKAVDWKGININEDGSGILLKNPETTFYSDLAHNPCDNIVNHTDNLNIFRMPIVILDDNKPDPNKIINDIWINSKNSKWYRWNHDSSTYIEGNTQSPLIKDYDSSKNSLFWGSVDNIIAKKKDDYLINFEDDKPYFNIYKSIDSGTSGKFIWSPQEKINIPGYTPYIPTDGNNMSRINSTSFKIKEKRFDKIILWIGCGLTGFGIFGTIFTFMLKPASKTSQKTSQVNPKK